MSEALLDQVDQGFRVYDELLGPMNANFPQRQGLLADEYQEAVNDPEVCNTTITKEDGQEVLLPQLSPIEHNSWLNQGFYERTFPDESARGAIRQFTDLPGMEPGEEVKQGLLDLAKKDGVLVFDYPDNDPEYPNRVLDLLEQVGVKPSGEVMSLGHQAYYTGKVHLKNGFDPSKPSLRLHDSLRAVKYEKRPGEPATGQPSYAQIMDPEDIQPMFEAYQKAFQVIDNYPCRQGFTWDEFVEVATEEPESAKIIYNIDGEPSVVCILGDDLSVYEWINPSFYEKLFPEEYKDHQILYYPAIASKEKGEGNMAHLLGYLCQMLEQGNMQPQIAFDCCDQNIDMLDILLEAVINETPEVNIKFDKKGTQTYAAVKLSAA